MTRLPVYHHFDGKLCISGRSLIKTKQNPEGVISKYTWDDWVKRHGANLVQRGGNGRISLIEFSTIPMKYRELIRETYGDPEKKAQGNSFLSRVEPDKKAATFFLGYRLENGQSLPGKHIKQYSANAAILNTIKELYQTQRKARAAHGKDMRGFWPRMADTLHNLKTELNHSLPKNHLALKRKYNEYQKAGYEALISGKFCNANTAKITPEIEAWLIKEMAYTRQSVDMVYMRYHAEAQRKGWRTDITASAFRERVGQQRVRDLIDFKRHGRKGFRKLHGHTFKLKKPEFSNDIWVSDGTALNWYFRDENNKLAMATTYMVMDAKSRKFLGWSTKAGINKENFAMQLEAYRMAIRNSGAKPYQLLFDNQGGHKMTESREFYSKIATVSFATRAYRPSGKPIEQAFKYFQQLKLSEFPFWSGFGRESHSNLAFKPNMEAMQKNIEHLPSYDELIQLFDIVVEEWNELAFKGKPSPNEVYEASRNLEEEAITIEEMAELFWNVSSPRKYNSVGIKLKVQGEESLYEVYDDNGDVDFNFRMKHLHSTFHLRYDPDGEYPDIDLLQIHPTGGFQKVATASKKREVARAVRGLKEGDKAWIERQMKLEDESMDERDTIIEGYGYDETEKFSAWQNRLKKTAPVMALDDDEDDDPQTMFLNRI